MEKTIDRTSYRRSARNDVASEKIQYQEATFKFANFIANEVIVSLLIIAIALFAKYFEINEVTDWIVDNMKDGYTVSELIGIAKGFAFNTGANNSMFISGEKNINSGEISGDMSGDLVNVSGDLISAVEGVNQMAEDAKFVRENFSFALPLNGTITSTFGCRNSDSKIVSSYHTGLDIAANKGTKISAICDGKVTLSKNFSSYGNCVMVENAGMTIVYAHCSSLSVKEGQIVKKGDLIGTVGMTGNATGPHLHLEIRYNGRYIDPSDVLKIGDN